MKHSTRHIKPLEGHEANGAGAFAADPDHYNFFGRKCVKDLKLSQAAIRDADERLSCMLEFEPYQFKHDLGLALKYNDVTEVATRAIGVDEETVPAAKRLGCLQLDEILPHDRGFTHEIQFTAGSIWIVAHDLSFDWRELDPTDTHFIPGPL